MNQLDVTTVRRPRSDDRLLWDVYFGAYGYFAVHIAHGVGVFTLLADSPRTLDEVCEALGLKRRAAEAVLAVCVSHGLLSFNNGRYALTTVAEDYLLPTSPTYFGGQFDWNLAHPEIITLDRLPVCEVAQEYATKYGLADRLGTHAADMWNDPYPEADVHFYGMIFHDWSADQCRFLTRKSFESLSTGGRIIIHEMLFNQDRTGPFGVAAFNMVMLTYLDGEQYSGREITGFLSEAGFTDIQVTPTFGYWSIITGRKA